MSNEEADVLIVGGGPVGLTMAAELSYRGINTILIEKNATTSDTPKALLLNCRSMEHFRRLGMQDKIQQAAYPRDLVFSITVSTGAYKGDMVYKKDFSSWGEIADDGLNREYPFFQYGTSINTSMFIPQFTSEVVIRKHIEDTSKIVEMFWGWQVTSINQDEDGVTVKAVNEASEEKTFRGRFMVGCDGGSSFVRKELGIHTYGHYVISRACTISFRSPQLLQHMKTNKTTGFFLLASTDITCVFVLLNGKGEFAMHILLPSSTPDETVEWHVQNPEVCVNRALGSTDIAFEVMYVSGYNMHALLATKMHEGRCFLAGDSAHQWLPAGGLGLNTGISDVANLSWKIEAMVKGYGGKHLLGSYEIERRSLVDSTRRMAMKMGEGAGIGRSSFYMKGFELMTRYSVFRYFLGLGFGKFIGGLFIKSLYLVLGFQYSNSNIIFHHYNENGSVKLHCNEAGKFTQASLPGCRAPHVVLPEHSSILDLFGKQFVILIIGGDESDLEDLKVALAKGGVAFESCTYPPLPELTELYDRKYFLIRPDGVISWRSDYQPSAAESSKIVSCILGHMTSRLPQPTVTFNLPPNPARLFLKDVVIRFGVTGLLSCYANLPPLTASMIGFGITVLLRAAVKVIPPQNIQHTSRHQAAVIDKYGNANEVLRIESKHVGKFGPNDVLIRVRASSINEIDLQMRGGYGSVTYQKLAKHSIEGAYFPLVLGRDCSGEVAAVGDNVSKYLPGDLVFAAVPPYQSGTHTQLVAVNENQVAFKPSNVDHKVAASLPWVAMTTWTALVKHAGLDPSNTRGKKVLVHQGTGGVGSFAIQLLKAWGANVTTTCVSENTPLAHHLGADKVVDDKTGDFSAVLGGYDIVLDSVGEFERSSLSVLKYYQRASYISLVSPRKILVDKLGGFFGEIAYSWLYRYKIFINFLFGGRVFYYSETEIEGEALDAVRDMVESGAVRPLIDAVYLLDEIIVAHKHVETAQIKGKVVLSIP